MASVLITQDQDYIQDVREYSSKLIQVANIGAILDTAWNNCFGGETRLVAESFGDTGLVKADIEAAKNAIVGVQAAIATGRAALEKVFDPAYNRV
jgi:hypothetical protein